MEQIVNILCGHQDTNVVLEHIESLITAVDAVLSSDSSSSYSGSSDSSSDNDDKDDLTIKVLDNDVKVSPINLMKIVHREHYKHDGFKIEIDNAAQVEPTNFVTVIDKYIPEVFNKHMRMKSSTAQYLIDGFSSSQYIPKLSHGGRQSINGKKSVYMFIWYIGNYITFTQLAELFNVSKSTAWITVKRVSSWLISIGHEKIKWPNEAEQINRVQRIMPGIIGVIGCTRINIRPPNKDKESYLDRHQNHSLVLQAVVDADNKFIHIACSEPGSLHNYSVLRKSSLYLQTVTNADELFPNNSFLLGDAAYPPSRWIVTPYINYGNLNETKKKFNDMHAATRAVIENTFGLLKMRFRKLQKFREQINISTITNLVVSACVLHNICITMSDVDILADAAVYDNQSDIESEVYNDVFPEDSNSRDILFNYLLQEHII